MAASGGWGGAECGENGWKTLSSLFSGENTDRFYPDFVGELKDGRRLVVEYKGALIAQSSDTDEKRTIGALWEKTSAGQGLFVVIEKDTGGKDMRAQLAAKLAG